jgi:hypothetical protein
VIEIINKVFLHDTHRSSDKPDSISATGLLGSKFRIKQFLIDTPKDPSLIDIKFKRSSTLGSAFHAYAEEALKGDPGFVTEKYMEREVTIDDITYTISGSFDGLVKTAGGWCLFDYKTGYGKDRKEDQLRKDTMQLSIYRWLLNGTYDVADTAFVLFVSMSNNVTESYTVELRSEEYIQNWIEETIWTALNTTSSDCQKGVRYNACDYCDIICNERRIK